MTDSTTAKARSLPLVSVVTAVFNREDTIAEAIQSVAAQDYADVEHVIQDGGSRDGTLQVIDRVAGPAVSLQSTPDGGIYEGINRGIARTTGDIIGLMHSDDLFADAGIVSAVAAAFDDSEIDGVYGDLDYVAANDTGRIIRKWRSGVYTPDKLRRGWMPPHPTPRCICGVRCLIAGAFMTRSSGSVPITTRCCVIWSGGRSA
ncbi:glycosyltransferase [Lacimonas salitolerans]|uniref:Glycosyltransferase n=1 Tax=Lacimonas salitolerans TaxID=1323750 RepID=A0ABW4EI17_9RHOB